MQQQQQQQQQQYRCNSQVARSLGLALQQALQQATPAIRQRPRQSYSSCEATAAVMSVL
jgi:hypothetical protein